MGVNIPLALDFDGTLHHGDLGVMALRWLLGKSPKRWGHAVYLLARYGKVAHKVYLEKQALKANWLPALNWDARLLAFASQQAQKGREVLVVTGSAQTLVENILRAHNLPYPVIGTVANGPNLIARHKARALIQRYGEHGFDYAGNSADDLKVWPHARRAIIANASSSTIAKAKATSHVSQIFPKQ